MILQQLILCEIIFINTIIRLDLTVIIQDYHRTKKNHIIGKPLIAWPKKVDHYKETPKYHYKTAKKEHVDIKNHLSREFSPVRPNQVWCGDVTYLWVAVKWQYLATVLDLYGRKIIGFSLSNSPDSELTKHALKTAYEARGCPTGMIFHSDQGCHYMSLAYRQLTFKSQNEKINVLLENL